MALHPDFPESPHEIIDPSVRWLPDQSLLFDLGYEMLLPPLVQKIREQVKTWRDNNYSGASETSKALLNWWFNTRHLQEQSDNTVSKFRYYFAQREAIETVSIEDIHNRLLQKGSELALQVDVTATPKHSNGAIFVQTVSDYLLVEAISQNVVKHPVLPDAKSRAKLVERQSVKYTEKYADYLELGVVEWRKAYAEHEKLGKKAILFVMTDNTQNCDEVAAHLENLHPALKDAVLVIHTNKSGEISEAKSSKKQAELEKLRKQANDIDSLESPYKAIVSVLMLKEGWDVKNVTTIVGLRAYSAKPNILPEQNLGRGLRHTLQNLSELPATKTVIETFKYAINDLTIQDKGDAELSETTRAQDARPFMVKEQEYLVPQKSVFNRITGDSHFELEFAAFLENCSDVVSYAKNYFGVHFKLDYINADDDISNYLPRLRGSREF